MSPEALVLVAALAGLAGVGLLRLAWSKPRRSPSLNLAGWAMILAGTLCGWAAAGAWGTTVSALFPMLGALVLLSVSALQSKPGNVRASNRRVGMLPGRGEPRRIAGRCLTFVLVAVVAALLGIGVAVAVGALAVMTGAAEANAYALTLFVTPLAWAGIAFALLMQSGRRGQIKVLGLASMPVWPTLVAGILS